MSQLTERQKDELYETLISPIVLLLILIYLPLTARLDFDTQTQVHPRLLALLRSDALI
jgi:fumarate reductase subunit D